MRPPNDGLRFLLELSALAAVAYWGWSEHGSVWRWVLVVAAPLAFGTVLVVAWAVSAVAGGAARSLPHSIHNRVATISQAKIRKVRVWFMGKGSWRRVGSADARARH